MGSDGSRGPKPYQQRAASTIFLRVPAIDWVPVTRGTKTEFRAAPNAVTQVLGIETPTPVVGYRVARAGAHAAQLMILEDTWQEPLGAISPESLEREGFPDIAHFRRYWMQRTRRRFAPMQTVRAFRVRPFEEPADWMEQAEKLMTRLYGAFRQAS